MGLILFDYKCISCNNIHEEIKPTEDSKESTCPNCGAVSKRIFSMRHRYKDFVEGWWEDITTDPIYIHNRRHLREECEKHGCYANIDDGILGV